MREARFGKLIETTLISLLLLNLSLLTYYIFSSYQNIFHSDAAALFQFGKEIFSTGSLLPDTWYYLNGDLFLFGKSLLIACLQWTGLEAYQQYALASLSMAAMVLVSTALIVRTITKDRQTTLLTLAIIAGGLSSLGAENLFGQTSYGTIFIKSCFLYLLAIKCWQATQGSDLRYWVGFALVLYLFSLENPQRALITYCLPLLSVSLGRLLQHEKSQVHVKFMLTLTVAFLLAFVSHRYLVADLMVVSGSSNLTWLAFEQWLTNLKLTLFGLFHLLAAVPVEGASVISVSGVYEALKLSTGVFILIILIPVLVSFTRNSDGSKRDLAIYSLVSTLPVAFLFLVTSLGDMNDPVQSIRYLIPGFLFILLLVLTDLTEKLQYTSPWNTAIILIVLGMLTIRGFDVYIEPDENLAWGQPGQIYPDRQELIDFLESNNLHFGYASYWHAGSMTVLSNQATIIRPIGFSEGLPRPSRHLSSENWFKVVPEKQFIMTTSTEAQLIDWALLETYIGQPVRELVFNDFTIKEYSHWVDLMPHWNIATNAKWHFPVYVDSRHQIGALRQLTPSEYQLVSDIGDSGFLHFGPYRVLTPGRYIAQFDLTPGCAESGEIGWIDVLPSAPDTQAVSRTITTSQTAYSIEFTVEVSQPYEFRVFSNGQGCLTYGGVTLSLESAS